MKKHMNINHNAEQKTRHTEDTKTCGEVFNHEYKDINGEEFTKRKSLCSVNPCWKNLMYNSQAGMVSADELFLASGWFPDKLASFFFFSHLIDQSSLKYI